MSRVTMKAAAVVVAAFIAAPGARAQDLTLKLPIDCEIGKSCWVQQYVDHDSSPGVKDYACGGQTYDGHDGTDIRIRDTASGAKVIASAEGTVKAVRDGEDDRLMRTEADRAAIADRECGNGLVIAHDGGWETQYCHLRNGSIAVKAGDAVTAGQTLGAVGYSGMAAFPHVHLTVRKDGKAIDPFSAASDAAACGSAHDPLWTDDTLAALAYARGNIIRSGLAPGAVAMTALEAGKLPGAGPSPDWPAMVAYAWAINLEAGDTIRITLNGPDDVAAENTATLDRAKAQYLLFAGKKRPARGWPKGLYKARIEVENGGTVRLSQSWQTTLE